MVNQITDNKMTIKALINCCKEFRHAHDFCFQQLSDDEIANLIRERLLLVIQSDIKIRLNELVEFTYDNGCVMFNTDICTPDEALHLGNNENGILDALSRVLAETILQ